MSSDFGFNGTRRVPPPVNEPVKGYAPGSPERTELKARLAQMAAVRIEIPLVIGGKEVRGAETAKAVMPHDHAHVLADRHKASREQVAQAIGPPGPPGASGPAGCGRTAPRSSSGRPSCSPPRGAPRSTRSAYQIGQELKVSDVISAGDTIDVMGITKGKGFQGVVRRYGFAVQSAGHGTHESFRGPGSVGNRSFPGRMFRGKRMDGHMGSARRTTQNLKVVQVRADEGLVLVRGALPGSAGERVVLRRSVKQKVA